MINCFIVLSTISISLDIVLKTNPKSTSRDWMMFSLLSRQRSSSSICNMWWIKTRRIFFAKQSYRSFCLPWTFSEWTKSKNRFCSLINIRSLEWSGRREVEISLMWENYMLFIVCHYSLSFTAAEVISMSSNVSLYSSFFCTIFPFLKRNLRVYRHTKNCSRKSNDRHCGKENEWRCDEKQRKTLKR